MHIVITFDLKPNEYFHVLFLTKKTTMKKIFTLLTLLMFGLATFTQASTSTFKTVYLQHLKKDGTPDKRFKENKMKGPMTKKGKPDMRYKANNPNAGKKKHK